MRESNHIYKLVTALLNTEWSKQWSQTLKYKVKGLILFGSNILILTFLHKIRKLHFNA